MATKNLTSLLQEAMGYRESILDLTDTVRFRKRKCLNNQYCTFSDFVRFLMQSTSVRSIHCHAEFTWNLRNREWIKLIYVFGLVKGLRELKFIAPLHGPPMRSTPFVEFARLIYNARELRVLLLDRKTVFEGDLESYHAFANALKNHPNLRKFSLKSDLFLHLDRPEECFDPIALSLSECPNLEDATLLFPVATGIETFLSAQAVQTLIGTSPKLKKVRLTTKHWQAVALGLENEKCSLERCSIGQLTATLSDIQSLGPALRNRNSTLQHLQLVSGTGFDDSMGLVIAEALKTNRSLKLVELLDTWRAGEGTFVHCYLREPTYTAFSECLNVNYDVRVLLKVGISRDDLRGVEAPPGFHSFKISSILNRLGRGKLLANEAEPEGCGYDWLSVLVKLSDPETYGSPVETDLLATSCIYSLLRSNPNVIGTGLRDSNRLIRSDVAPQVTRKYKHTLSSSFITRRKRQCLKQIKPSDIFFRSSEDTKPFIQSSKQSNNLHARLVC